MNTIISVSFNYSEDDIKKIYKKIIDKSNKWLSDTKKNINISPNDFLISYLYHLSEFDYIYGLIIFLQYVSSNKNIREASSKFDLDLQKYYSNYFNSEENYKLFLILKKIKCNNDIDNDPDNTKKLIKNILKSFEDNGVNLNKYKKEEFIKINKKLMVLENNFSQNIANDIKKIKYIKRDLNGIEHNILKNHQVDSDEYIFNTTYPDELAIMKNCSIELSREKMYYTFNTVAKKNLPILKNIINLRSKISNIFGFKNSVDYFLDNNRIAKKKEIDSLLYKFIPILKKKSINEYTNLCDKLDLNKDIYDYNMSYYNNIYKKKYLDLTENTIKEYFPSNYSIPKILTIFSNLFDIEIILLYKNKSHYYQYYHQSIDLYIIKEKKNKTVLGYMYVDLYPRDGKFTHAATFDLQNTYKNNDNIRIIPITAIVCNFSPPKKSTNFSLLSFNEIVTFCHELGHALHNILSNVKYEKLSGISMESDFGEMPSQFFENWCYCELFLKKITKHYKTDKKLPKSIIFKIIQNKNFNFGMQYLTQILYIKYDLEIHQKKNVDEKYLHDIWFKIAQDLLPFNITTNTFPMCRFDHIIGYASGYYGYLWSLIYSYDAFKLFKLKGIFNKELGARFRMEILEKGGTVKGTDMLKKFCQDTHIKKYDTIKSAMQWLNDHID